MRGICGGWGARQPPAVAGSGLHAGIRRSLTSPDSPDQIAPKELMVQRIVATLAAVLMAVPLAAGPLSAQSYPSRYVTLIVPYAPGGSVAAAARGVAAKGGDKVGQSVLVASVAGAGGIVGAQKASTAAPNGYTLLFSVESTMAIAKLVSPNTVQYDSQKDFVPITLIGTSPLVLAGKKSLPANNIAELMTLLRDSPGQYNYATSGAGTSLHVAGEMINQQGHVSMVHVPYRIGSQMVTDLVGDQIDLALLPLGMALPNYQSARIKPSGVTQPTPSRVGRATPRVAGERDPRDAGLLE